MWGSALQEGCAPDMPFWGVHWAGLLGPLLPFSLLMPSLCSPLLGCALWGVHWVGLLGPLLSFGLLTPSSALLCFGAWLEHFWASLGKSERLILTQIPLSIKVLLFWNPGLTKKKS